MGMVPILKGLSGDSARKRGMSLSVQIRKDKFEKQLWVGFDVLMYFRFSLLVENTDVHFSGVQIDTAIILVLLI